MTKCSPFPRSLLHRRPDPHPAGVFLPPNILYTLDFAGCLSLLFAVNFCRLHRGSSPWIFISPLTPLNVNSSFPVLLFISVAWWFDHAGNTRLAIALSLVSPQGHLLLKCYCLCFLTLYVPASVFFLRFGRIEAILSLFLSLTHTFVLHRITWEHGETKKKGNSAIK